MTPARIQRIAIGLALGAACLAGCNSDEVPRSANEETSDEEGTTDPTEDTGDWPREDLGPPGETTCRDATQCLLACAATYPANPTPEDPTLEDFFLACFLECSKELDAQESLAFIELVSCISDVCYGGGTCVAGMASNECTICLTVGLLDEAPPGCEAEAEACK